MAANCKQTIVQMCRQSTGEKSAILINGTIAITMQNKGYLLNENVMLQLGKEEAIFFILNYSVLNLGNSCIKIQDVQKSIYVRM